MDSKNKKFSADVLISPILMWLIIALGAVVIYKILGSQKIIPLNMFTPLLILPALIYFIYFYIGALKTHRQATRSVASISHIVKTGVYGKCRHPIYSADIALVWGIFFLHPNQKIFFSAIWATIIFCSLG